MATKIRIRTPQGVKTLGISDVRPYWLYDSNTFPAATPVSEQVFFRTPEGKSLVDTNMRQFSTIQVGWTFEVSEIRVIPRVNIPIADMESIFANSILSFLREGDIEVFTFPTVMANAGCGLYGATTNASEDVVSLGLPSSGSVLKLPIKFLLYGGETFQFRLQYNPSVTLSTARSIYMVLSGVLKRGIRGA